MVAANEGVVQLSQAVASVHVHRVHMETLNRAVRNLEFQLLPGLGPLEPILGLLDHHTAGSGLLHHAAPRIQIVKGGGAGAIVHCRIGVAEPGRAVSAGALGRTAGGPVPLHAVDGHKLGIDLHRLVSAGQIVGASGHFYRDDRCAGGIIDTVHRFAG